MTSARTDRCPAFDAAPVATHPALRRQLDALELDPGCPPLGDSWRALLDEVSRSYIDADRDREALQHAERAPTPSDASHGALFDHAPIALMLFDAETHRVLAANERAVDLFGYSREELAKLSMLDLKEGEEPPAFIARVMSHGEGIRRIGIKTHRKKDGSLVELDVHSSEVTFEGRRAILAALHEVTETHQLEERLRRAHKMEAIGRLAGGVAHDFNNMLCIILGYTVTLLDGMPASDPTYEALTEVRRAAERSAQLTEQLLAFSRQRAVERRVVSLTDTVARAVRVLERVLGQDIAIDARLTGDPCMTTVPHGQIEEIILNLALNARDALPRGGKLTLETALVDVERSAAIPGLEPGRYATLRVSDDGVGMDAPTRARAFEPFFTTKEYGKGSGLGLATVFGVVSQGGGHVTLDSAPGKGTTFTLYFPAHRGKTADLAAGGESEAPSQPLATVLLVEDDAQVRTLYDRVLRKLGYRVLAASLPEEAVRLCASHAGAIDLLLTDVMMPQMNGRDLADRLLATRPTMKVLYMSGYTSDVVVDEGAASAPFAQKPITPAALRQLVHRVLASGVAA